LHGDRVLPEDYAEETDIGEGSAHVIVGDRSHDSTGGSATFQVVLDQLLIARLGDSWRPKAKKNGT